MESHSLLVTLVVALGAALIGAVVAARLGQSVILGYIVAGIAIGPFTPGPIGDVASVQVLADIGIIFLMFAIGVQLSVRELLHAGRIATFGGIGQILAISALGYAVGQMLGWRPLESLFFGAVLSIASSAVLTKLLAEHGEMDTPHGRIAVGWSAVQDLATVVLVVVVSGLSTGGERLLVDLAVAGGKALLFLALVVPIGSRVLPILFERVAALRNREIFLLTTAAVALGTAYLSTFFGLSLALGAFIAGVVVSESDLSHQILGEIMPLRDIFAGLFFVSVGMLVDPIYVAGNIPLVLLTLVLIVPAKGLVTTVFVLLGRYPVRTSVRTGVLLAQAGEFSFLLARLGVDLGAVSAGVFSMILAGAVASIILAPLLYQSADPLVGWLEARLPKLRASSEPNPEDANGRGPRGHAVLCGYGRVGQIIGTVLERRGFHFLVIEEDQRIVRELRARGVMTLLGDAANQVLLDRARLREARVLIVAIPDPLSARRIVDYALGVNDRLDIVARTHSPTELTYLRRRGVGEAVMGELELALEMTRHTLHRFGVSGPEIQVTVQGLREHMASDAAFEEWERPG
jgi:CPA2 family monovalent cation:H+ antiporter-2